MPSRREVCLGLITIPVSAGTCCAAHRSRGCALALDQGRQKHGDLKKFPGGSEVARFCYEETRVLTRHFEVDANFAFFGGPDSDNAFATEAFRGNERPSVLFGELLIDRIRSEFKEDWELIITAVLAHEWAHIYQFKRKANPNWDVQLELQADFLAGWYLGLRRPRDLTTFRNIGKFFENLGDTQFMSEEHHGTPKQRRYVMLHGAGLLNISAAEDGVEGDLPEEAVPAPTIEEAYQQGIEIVR